MSRQGVVVGALVLVVGAGTMFMVTSGPSPAREAEFPEDVPSAVVAPAPALPPAPAEPGNRAPANAPAAPRTPASIPPADVVTLTVEADVSGAQVFVDRQFLGLAPLTRSGIQPGRRQINVTAPGYVGHVETVELEAGLHQMTVNLRDVRLDARTAVVHDHAFGSCEGTLVATAEGLRYETTHQNDAFAAPLTAFEALQVDYLEKTLRIVGPAGRAFQFTHPEGDADRLLVFERDVNRARQRLLSEP